MPGTDPHAASRLVHVCPDPAVAGLVESAVAATGPGGLVYRHFEDAFAAALELLTDGPAPGGRTVLLLALDGLAGVELPLAAWAAARWPDMPIWAHGSPDRLNGELADGRIEIVQLASIAECLSRLPPPREPAQPEPVGALAPPTPAPVRPIAVELPAGSPEVQAGHAVPNRASSEFGPDAAGAGFGSGAPAEAEPAPPPAAEPEQTRPTLRVHRPAEAEADRPVLTEEELASLLGWPEEADEPK